MRGGLLARRLALGLVAGLAACGPTYEEGMMAQGRLHCELLEACDALADVGYDSVGACITDAEGQNFGDCPGDAYRADNMAACVEAWEAAVAATECDASPVECMPAQVCPR